MENVGAIFEGEWNSVSGMCSEEADFMAHLLENSSLPNQVLNGFQYAVSWPENFTIAEADESSVYSSEETNNCMFSFSQGSNYSGGSRFFSPYSSKERHCPSVVPRQIFVDNDNLMAMNYCMLEDENNSSRMHLFTSNSMEDGFLNQDIGNDSTESNEDLPEDYPLQNNLQNIENPLENRIGSSSVISSKRPRIPAGEKSKRFKKASKVDIDGVYDNYKNNSMPRSSSFCSDDISIVSHEINVTSTSTGAPKMRASRGSATDPQSLYARKRRERINERLKILQKLVPNGTKVDISTMLEEAVEYVKFLQLQIKLLSSDDHWMYAPLAYNGMEIGLDLKISASLS